MEHQQALKGAAEAGDINVLYSCIQQDPHILDLIDKIPFVDTPLHAAASAGHDHFALEILRLKPSFGRKLNLDGLSPLDLALRNGHSRTVRRFIKFDKELIRVKGRESLTPLHYVAETNHIDLLAEFLCACPASIEGQTIRAENALHIAVKNCNLKAFKVLLGWLRRTYQHPLKKMLNLEDDEGNNVLHIAVYTSQPQIVKLLVERTRVNLMAKNQEGLTAFDIVAKLGSDQAKIKIKNILRGAGISESSSLPNNNNNVYTLADFLMSPQGYLERAIGWTLHAKECLSSEKPYINIVLVVAVLLATATYQVVLSPPGGGVIDHNNATNDLLPPNVPTTTNLHVPFGYYLFYSLNTMTFMCSILVILNILRFRPFGLLLQTSLIFMMFSYGFAFQFISPSQSFAQISFLVAYLAYLRIIPDGYVAMSVFQRERFEMLHRCFMNYD